MLLRLLGESVFRVSSHVPHLSLNETRAASTPVTSGSDFQGFLSALSRVHPADSVLVTSTLFDASSAVHFRSPFSFSHSPFGCVPKMLTTGTFGTSSLMAVWCLLLQLGTEGSSLISDEVDSSLSHLPLLCFTCRTGTPALPGAHAV